MEVDISAKPDTIAESVVEAAATEDNADTTLAVTALPRVAPFSTTPTSPGPELRLGRLTNLVHQNTNLKLLAKTRC